MTRLARAKPGLSPPDGVGTGDSIGNGVETLDILVSGIAVLIVSGCTVGETVIGVISGNTSPDSGRWSPYLRL